MKRLVILASSYDTVCFPTTPPYRVVTAGGNWSTTVAGAHRATLVANLTRFLNEFGFDVEDVEQADGEGCFAMVIMAKPRHEVKLAEVRALLERQGKEWGISLRVQREDLFLAMHRI